MQRKIRILLILQRREIQVWWMLKLTKTMKVMSLRTLNMMPFTNLRTSKSPRKGNKLIYSIK